MPIYTKTYKDLIIWQRSHALAKYIILKLKEIKGDEIFNIIKKQVFRSATSTPANIVEGYYTRKGKQFSAYLERARGSLAETDYWLLMLTELNYFKKEEYEKFSKELNEIILMISAFIQKTKN